MISGEKEKRSEFALIDWIQQQVAASELTLGIGDDCAIATQDSGQDLLTSTDLLIEGIHFRCDWGSYYDLGRKSAAVNLSDIAAMGGRAQSLFLALGRPVTIADSAIEEFIRGFIAETERYGATLAGGDTCASPGPLMISVTAQGTVAKGCAVRRSGAVPGHSIYVSGTLGDSALALQFLLENMPVPPALGERFYTPTARLSLGGLLAGAGLAGAMLDISDGLLGDLEHILAAAQVGAELQLDRLPLSAAFAAALEQDDTLIDLALSGGEDYELLFCSARDDLERLPNLPTPVTRIGTITREQGTRILTGDGAHYRCRRKGFDHFNRKA
jgi:thiamine-monophosphate kinase